MPSDAADIRWRNPVGGAFSAHGSWFGNVVPGAADVAQFGLAPTTFPPPIPATYTVSFTANATHQGDADNVGNVDGAELLVWQRQNGLSFDAIAAAAAMPEPARGILAAAAVALFARHWRQGARQKGPGDPRRRRMHYEPLEDRRLLAGVTVGNLNDVVNGTTTSIAAQIATPGADGISLREAILAANEDSTDPSDTIDFAPSVTGTIQLTNVGHAGEIAISGLGGLSINGPGADVLTIRAFRGAPQVLFDGARIFNVNNTVPFLTSTVAISGLTLTGGEVNGEGGAIFNAENLTISSTTVFNNSASNRGGGIANSGGNLTIINSAIAGNNSFNTGGGGISSFTGSLTIRQSDIRNNTALSFGSGGGVYSQQSPITIESSTIRLNPAQGNGGGVFAENADMNITNSTISQNSTQAAGGGVATFRGLNLRHSTVTLNRSDADNAGGGAGGGVAAFDGSVVVLDQSIVADNFRGPTARDDVSGPMAARFSLIGDNTGATIANNGGNQIGTGAAPINALLAPLADNGGAALTHALLPGSPALDAGDPAVIAGIGTVPLNDMRGAAFARVRDGDGLAGSRIDIGAFEQQTTQAAPLIVSSLTDNNDGNLVSGFFSLREAIGLANTLPLPPRITFAPSLGGGDPYSLVLTLGELAITRSVAIEGPGTNVLTIDANGNDPTGQDLGDGTRVFHVSDGLANNLINVTLSGMLLTGGDSMADGGAILNHEQLTLTDCRINVNATRNNGGAIANSGVLNVVRSEINANTALLDGGGVYATGGSLTVAESGLGGNRGRSGGGIYSSVTTTVTAATFAGNLATATSAGGGGAIFLDDGANNTATIVNSTFRANTAVFNGGAILVANPDAFAVALRHSTLAENRADSDNNGGGAGGGIHSNLAPVIIDHTIVAENLRQTATRSDLSGPMAMRFSLIGVDAGASIINNGSNQIGTTAAPIDPMLGEISNNFGGFLSVYSLLIDSPALDAGDPAAVAGVGGIPASDQRGGFFSRVFGGRIDLGAFERQSLSAGVLRVDSLVDEADGIYSAGRFSLREAINIANRGSIGADSITFAAALTSGGPGVLPLSLGELTIEEALTITGPGSHLLTIDVGAFAMDPTPAVKNGDGSRVFTIVGAPVFQKVTLSGLSMTGGDADGSGGAIRSTVDLTLIDCTISGNSAMSSGGQASYGGGVYSTSGDLTIINSTISGGRAFRGGGISSRDSHATINGSTIVNNDATYGGGLFSQLDHLVIVNSTVSGNKALQAAGLRLASSATINHSTITGNIADPTNTGFGFAGGIDASGGNLTLDHAIVAENRRANSTRDDIRGLVTARFSLIGDRTGASIINNGGNLIGTSAAPIDALLGPLAANGGKTMTHALMAGSPAINAGDPAAAAGVGAVPQFDQRGVPFTRVHGGRIDIGAFEVQPAAANADFDADSRIDGADFLHWQRGFGLNGAAATLANGNADGDDDVDEADLAVWLSQFGATANGGPALAVNSTASFSHQGPVAEETQMPARDNPDHGLIDAVFTSLSLFDPADAHERPLRGKGRFWRAAASTRE